MDQKTQIAEKLKTATNILVTVSNNPSVDQLASCIGLTLALNKMGKHATAVFSGKVPSTIEFLEPEKTFEGNIDTLRDFIISLDKNKADKLRYKVEDTVVKIFITPYHTSLSDKDLEFSLGDFNVDAVVALGVIAQADIDQAISAHGRILHDAAVLTLNIAPGGDFGSVNWLDPAASSLCELAAQLIDTIDKQIIDGQIATALLTGIVAETQRFSNSKTTPATMTVSALLMGAGANQQLVVTKLEQAVPPPPPAPVAAPAPPPAPQQPAPGEIQIRQADAGASQPVEHTVPIGGGAAQPTAPPPAPEPPKPVSSLEDLAAPVAGQENKEPELARIRIDDQGSLHTVEDAAEPKVNATTDPMVHMGGSRMILQPPTMGDGAGGLVGDVHRDPFTTPQENGPSAEQPSGAPAPSPFMPPSMTPAVPAPAAPPAQPVSTGAAPAAPDLGAIHPDNARGAVAQAYGAVPAPPNLAVPAPTGVPAPAPANAVPLPAGPPPPVPPPLVPTMPQ